tara:strand:+ start:2645 stop:3388 length:744 start_codon:yes stop_codon:yes gene_type:complete
MSGRVALGIVGARLTGLFPIALAVASAAAILYLSIPRTASAFLTISGDRVLEAIEKGRPVTPAQLSLLERAREEALNWTVSAKAFRDLSIARNLRWTAAADDTRADVDRDIVSLTTRSLTLSPANSQTWLRLASAEARMNGDTELVSEALGLSFLTGPVLPLQTLYRLNLALVSARFDKSADSNLIFRQMRIAWKVDKQSSIRLSAASVRNIALFRAALASDPIEYDKYNMKLEQYFDQKQKKPSAP